MPMSLETIAAFAFAWTMWAVMFWGSIAVVERDNPVNRFSAALGWSALSIAVGFLIRWIGKAASRAPGGACVPWPRWRPRQVPA